MKLKNQIATYGAFVITEEVNCYLVWYLVFGMNVNQAFFFNDIPSKDQAFQDAKNHARQQDDNLTRQ